MKLFAQTSNWMFVSITASLKEFHGESEIDDLTHANLDSVSKWETKLDNDILSLGNCSDISFGRVSMDALLQVMCTCKSLACSIYVCPFW